MTSFLIYSMSSAVCCLLHPKDLQILLYEMNWTTNPCLFSLADVGLDELVSGLHYHQWTLVQCQWPAGVRLPEPRQSMCWSVWFVPRRVTTLHSPLWGLTTRTGGATPHNVIGVNQQNYLPLWSWYKLSSSPTPSALCLYQIKHCWYWQTGKKKVLRGHLC